MTGTINEGNMTNQLVRETVHDKFVFFTRAHRSIANGSLALFVKTPVDFGVGIAQLDGDVPFQLILETDCVNAGEGFDYCRFAVSHMTNSA